MEAVLDAIRRNISRWVITSTQLTEDALAGTTTIKVRSTRRFAAGDEFLIKGTDTDGTEEVENLLIVDSIVDKNTITITEPLKWSWYVSEDATIIKTINNDFVRAIHIGEPDVIELSEMPAITVTGTNRISEWYTIRATKERFNLEIAVYVTDASHESGYRFLLRIVDIIQKGLKRNIYPLVNSYDQTSLLADIAAGDCVIKIADTSTFVAGSMIYFEDYYNNQENTVIEIIDANTVKVAMPFDYDYTVEDTVVIRPHRFVYNSWPSDITYGKIHKGTLLKAAVISYFVEETEIQGEGGFLDTQLK